MFKVIVAGSRGFNDYEMLSEYLDKMLSQKDKEEIEIVSGCAKGADTLAIRYAEERGLNLKRFPADWSKFGKSAGYRRNEQMADYADALVAFWDEESRGTEHMISIMKEKPTRIKKYKRG